MKLLKSALALGLVMAFFASNSQTFLGEPQKPASDTPIAELGFYGDANDFSGGYQVGDVVDNFRAFSVEGEPFKLSDVLGNGKYTLVCSASVTCVRFYETFDTENGQEAYSDTRTFLEDVADEFNMIWVYGPEAHPIDGECMSNCPLLPIAAPNGEYLSQHVTYGDRVDAASLWLDIVDDPEMNYDFDYDLVVDNPQNAIFEEFFQRPFGIVILDCTGEVVGRGDWIHQWATLQGGMDFIYSLIGSGECSGEPDFCEDDSMDSDSDGICDTQEIWEDWDPEDPNNPVITNPTSIGEIGEDEVVIFPNPFNEQITLQGVEPNDLINVFSSVGSLVYSGRVNGTWETFDLSNLARGMYQLSLTRNGVNGTEILSHALIKQ